MPDCGGLSRLRPADCSATVNVAIGILSERLDCTVDEAFRVVQAKAGEDPRALDRVARWVLARHVSFLSRRAGSQSAGCAMLSTRSTPMISIAHATIPVAPLISNLDPTSSAFL